LILAQILEQRFFYQDLPLTEGKKKKPNSIQKKPVQIHARKTLLP